MFFPLLKAYSRLALKVYCRRVLVNKPELLNLKGPVLLAANHPNSFLDGMILTTLFKENIYSLARGDVFRIKFFRRLLYWLHLRPVYRTSEGVENLSHNYITFAACHEVFSHNGIVIIFSEGGCVNEWHLRPLKKGTARLAISSWNKNIDLTVIPVGFNYSGFRNFGKNVEINFGDPLNKEMILSETSEGKQLLAFNEQLEKALSKLVYEIPLDDIESRKAKLEISVSAFEKIILFPFALAAYIVHAPIYLAVKVLTKKYFDNDHFDSVIVSALMLAYLFYFPALVVLAFCLSGWIAALATAILLPFCAWAFVRIRPQINKHYRV